MSLDLATKLIGGIGLFLLGMRLMTDGLRVAAGQALRDILTRSTRTRVRGVASGILVTSLVQSSSAVTVATIGFVNAGLLSLAQAIAVTYGSNIGTTVTGWLVAAIGFHVNVRAFALPLIGIGMALRIFVRNGRAGAIGEALAGFGVFFLGIDTLRLAFEGLSGQLELGALVGAGAGRGLLFVAIGFGLTLLMQSSSAAIAIILTAVGGGVVPLGSGAALVVGANVGTTSTAALAVIGATPNAKRVAAGHVVFNLVTGAVALALLPLLLLLIVRSREILELDAGPAAVLAAFHTIFNFLGVALLWPFTGRLLRFLERRFQTAEEDEARPRYLDRNVIETPRLALDAMALELTRAGAIARRLVTAALGPDARAHASMAAGQQSLAALVDAIGGYAQTLQRARIPDELDTLLPAVFRVSHHYAEAAEFAGMLATRRAALVPLERLPEWRETQEFIARVTDLVAHAGLEEERYSADAVADELAEVERRYKTLKAALQRAASHARLGVNQVVAALDWLSDVHRAAEQVERGTRHLASLAPADPED